MNILRNTLAPLLGAILAATFLAAPAQAQLGEDPQSLNAAATNEMKAGNWEAALKLLTRCTSRFDKNAMTLYGPQFGVTWYRKGFCEMKLKRWEDAMKSFETCYRKYPNKSAQAGGGSNVYNKKSLLYWAQAAQGAEDWGLAIRMYKKFLEERDKTKSQDSYERGAFYINMAICHFKSEKIPDGIENFETALKNKVQFETPEAGIVAAFQALVAAVIEKRDEKALLSFVEANRADIIIEPYDMQAYVSLFLSLAGQAYEAEMERAAFTMYQLIPSTTVMLEDVESRLKNLGDRLGIKDGIRVITKANLESSKEILDKARRSGDPHEVIQLSATAFIHEKHGNTRGAFSSYEQLEIFYPKSKKREDHLYNLVRTASIIGEVLATEEYGSRFLATFPDSKHVPAVRRLMLTSLFYGGEYEKCIEIATVMLPKLKEKTKEHDICLHVLSGSYYYTGQYDKAQPLLDQHVELYPKSSFEQASLYFQASNLSRLQYWAKAAKLLDEFFEKHPDPGQNIYFSFGLYDRANCHYAEGENDAALAKLNRLEEEFPNADIMDMAYNLKGNVLQNQGKREEAEQYYVKALDLAERRENEIVAGEALYYLVAMLGEKPKKKDEPHRMKDAVPYADKFWKQYGDASPYKAQVAVSQVHALSTVDRGQEALDRLRDVIAEMATTPGAVGLEEAINSYTEVYLEKHSAEELKDHYYAFPKIKATNKPANALLRIALIGVFEKELKKAGEDRQKANRAEAGIQVLFTDLKNDFDTDDLSNFILVRVGDFIRQTNSARQALPYYDAVLARKDQSYMFPALFGRAAILADGTNDEKKKAIADFKRVLQDSQDKKDKDNALFQMIATQLAMNDAAAADNAKLYLDREKGYQSRKAEVAMMLAQSYDKRGDVNNAIATYLNCWNSYKGALRISAPAMKRYMELLWARDSVAENGISDRQGAYNAGRDYTDQTERILGKATPAEQEAWKDVQKLVQQYVADSNVKSKEQQAEENKR